VIASIYPRSKLGRLHFETLTPPAALLTVPAVRSAIDVLRALAGSLAAFWMFVP